MYIIHVYTIYSEIALEIINSDHWDKAMRMCNHNNITPMRLLIEFMPGDHVIIQLCIDNVHIIWYHVTLYPIAW